jgi:hypothetical protein
MHVEGFYIFVAANNPNRIKRAFNVPSHENTKLYLAAFVAPTTSTIVWDDYCNPTFFITGYSTVSGWSAELRDHVSMKFQLLITATQLLEVAIAESIYRC